jgi:hypothetical protein
MLHSHQINFMEFEMTAESVLQVETKKRAERVVSTVEFPYIDLDAGIELVQGVHAVGGHSCDSDQLAAHLNMEAKGGAFRIKITGAQMFGLITYARGGRTELTDLGKRVLNAPNDKAVRANAFLSVELYRRVYDQYKGSPLPPAVALERAMKEIGVSENVADKARQVLMRSAKQAGFLDLAGDRLTMPPNGAHKPDAGAETAAKSTEPEQESRAGGNGGGGGRNHPLIDGLLVTLPQPGANWAIADRINWLNMAQSIFNAIYKLSDEDKDKKIDIKGS